MAAVVNGGDLHLSNTDIFDYAYCDPNIVLTNYCRTATATSTVPAGDVNYEFMHVLGGDTYAVGEHDIRIRFDNLLEYGSVCIGLANILELDNPMGLEIIGWTMKVGEDLGICLSGDEFCLHVNMENSTCTVQNLRTGWNDTMDDIGAQPRLLIGMQTVNTSVSILPI